MKIKVLGTGCANCKNLYSNVEKAIADMGIEATIEKEENIIKIMSYNIISTPGLVINERVVASGKRLNIEEIKSLIESNLNCDNSKKFKYTPQ